MDKNTIEHRPTTWKIKKDFFSLKFNNGEPVIELSSTKNGSQYTTITSLNREDLVLLRDTIDKYLFETEQHSFID